MRISSAAPSWFERLLLPELNSIKGEVKGLNGRIDGLEGRMTGQFEAVRSEIKRLDQKIDSTKLELGERIESLKSDLGVVKSELEVVGSGLAGGYQPLAFPWTDTTKLCHPSACPLVIK